MGEKLANYVIGIIIGILILGSLIGPIADFFIAVNRTGDPTGADPQGNYTGATAVLGALIPVILIAIICLKIWKGKK